MGWTRSSNADLAVQELRGMHPVVVVSDKNVLVLLVQPGVVVPARDKWLALVEFCKEKKPLTPVLALVCRLFLSALTLWCAPVSDRTLHRLVRRRGGLGCRRRLDYRRSAEVREIPPDVSLIVPTPGFALVHHLGAEKF